MLANRTAPDAFSSDALDQPSSAPRVDDGDRYGQSRRNPGPVIFRVLRRLWIPLVVLVVIAVGGLTVSRLHGLFGSDKSLSYADTRVDNKPYNPQHLRYEVFGPPGTVALISYFDDNGTPQHVDEVSLPWSLEFADHRGHRHRKCRGAGR